LHERCAAACNPGASHQRTLVAMNRTHPPNGALTALYRAGVSLWLDDLSRRWLRSGDLARVVAEKRISGVTSNPTILAAAVAEIDEYAEQVRDLAARGVPADDAFRALAAYDVRWACDVLRPLHDATGGVEGWVSIEVDPALAEQPEATTAEAKALAWSIDRPNLMVKIPATRASLPAITATVAAGISVNATLIFGPARCAEVFDSYLAGLEEARARGHDLASIHSVASFFVSRIDTEVDRRLDRVGSASAIALRGKAAVAVARTAHQQHVERLQSDRWLALTAAGARPQRLLWASTSVKDPALPDTKYVSELVARDVVTTMPAATLEAFADHGVVPADPAADGHTPASVLLDELAAVGIDHADVTRSLEADGVARFSASWTDAVATVDRALASPPKGSTSCLSDSAAPSSVTPSSSSSPGSS
jgi:transaldolase